MYFVTLCLRDRLPLLSDKKVSEATWNYLKSLFEPKGNWIIGAVFLHDHVHLIIELKKDSNLTLGKTVMDLKLGLWRAMRRAGIKEEKIWQKNYFEHVIRNNDDLVEKLRYMRGNPVKAGLVEKVEDWQYYWDRFL